MKSKVCLPEAPHTQNPGENAAALGPASPGNLVEMLVSFPKDQGGQRGVLGYHPFLSTYSIITSGSIDGQGFEYPLLNKMY